MINLPYIKRTKHFMYFITICLKTLLIMLRFQLRFVFMTNRFDTPVYGVIRNAVIKQTWKVCWFYKTYKAKQRWKSLLTLRNKTKLKKFVHSTNLHILLMYLFMHENGFVTGSIIYISNCSISKIKLLFPVMCLFYFYHRMWHSAFPLLIQLFSKT